MNNQYQQNNNQVNYNGQTGKIMQYNYQHPKKKNITLIIGLSIVGLFVIGIVVYFILYSISENQDTPWKSGQVQILGKDIQLPCDVDTFEKTLNTKIIDGEFSDEIKDVKIKLGYNSVLIFDVYVENNVVTGIMLDAYQSGETDKINPYLSYAMETERDTALNIVFPGDVTIETSIDKIKELYRTTPLNSNYTYWDEEIGYGESKKISAEHSYNNGEWSINIHTINGEITGIDYYYLRH